MIHNLQHKEVVVYGNTSPGDVPDLANADKLRVIAYLDIPEDASDQQAVGWVRTRHPRLRKEVVAAICVLHRDDKTVAEWRRSRSARYSSEFLSR